MTQLSSSEVVLKNTAVAVIVPLKNGISSLNRVYKALIKAHVDPVTGQCSKYNYIRQQIVQAHQHLEKSEQTASSGLKILDESLERLTQVEGKLQCEMNDTKQTLENLRTEQESNEKLHRDSQGALEQARTNLNSTKQTLQDQESRKQTAQIVTGVGAGLLVIPIVGWIAGSAMLIGGVIEMDQAARAIRVAEEEVEKSETEVEEYEHKVSDYESKISQTKRDIRQKDDKLKHTREEIQKVNKQIESVADFQQKVRRAIHLLGALSGRVSVAEHQTRRFILQEPVMKVMEDVMMATEQITGNEPLYDNNLPRLINQLKENSQRLAAICASETRPKNNTTLRWLCCFKQTVTE
ncbi:cancer-associated gene 1 protein-like [Pangasianodon hypophthalmus]|uniref:cancer-associated gene 1 protein-like n=1 Tax=Pangasianodon hypophthalmus TaxID=310915 RepID=UPI000F00076C|nr:cancer-associated gene 1 protein-like [Pangasianodon hypophthalmus]